MTSKSVWKQKPCFLPWNVQRQLESYTYPSGLIITKPTIKFSYLCVLATWCEELTHWKRPWCWERLRAGGEGDDRGWDGWMASLTWWTWVWVDSRSWWWTGKAGMLRFMRLQRVGHDWVTELNWTEPGTFLIMSLGPWENFSLCAVRISISCFNCCSKALCN